jgi:MoaA/NifB/PqqE/SkfB family radical SAM enzyme
MKKEICWNITARCNQNCFYCHRFNHPKDLGFEDNLEILNYLIEQGVDEITWTGGEALTLNYIDKLLKISHSQNIKNKLITNGKLLTKRKMKTILPYLDSITLSIDSTNDDINYLLGRGRDHYGRINEILEYIALNNIKIKTRVNTVVTKLNISSIDELAKYLNRFELYSWRIFKFMPLRETAKINKDIFEISESEFKKIQKKLKNNSKIRIIEFRSEIEMENNYILILADGSVFITKNGEDKKIGNILRKNVSLSKI